MLTRVGPATAGVLPATATRTNVAKFQGNSLGSPAKVSGNVSNRATSQFHPIAAVGHLIGSVTGFIGHALGMLMAPVHWIASHAIGCVRGLLPF